MKYSLRTVLHSKMLGLPSLNPRNMRIGKFEFYFLVSGESNSAPTTAIAQWKTDVLPKLLQTYRSRDIFNADETGIFFEAMPHRMHVFKGKACHGGKKSKSCLTALLCANMDGSEKQPALIIGKSKKPRCFKGIQSLPLPYR